MLHRWMIAIVVVTAGCKAHSPGGPGDAADPEIDAAVPIVDAGGDAAAPGDGGTACHGVGFPVTPWLGVGRNPTSIVAADLDGDRRPELIVGNSSASISVMKNLGGGRFRPAVDYPVRAGVAGLAVADVDRDGLPDVVVASGGASVLRGNADGTLRPALDITTTGSANSVAIADLDGDGVLDLVLGGATVTVLRGHGDGSFDAPAALEIGGGPVVLADVNNDGRLDVLAPDFNNVGVQLGRGDATFGPAARYVTLPDASGIAVIGGDLLVSTTFDEENNVSLLLGNGDGSFQAPFNFATGHAAVAVAVADLDGDHQPEQIFLASNPFGAVVAQSQVIRRIPVGPFATAMVVVDLDGDGTLDLATTSSEGDDVSVSLNLGGDATFPTPSTPVSPVVNFVADLDGDHVLDAIGATGATVVVQRGHGDGTFAPVETYPMTADIAVVLGADVDHDGVLDVITLDGSGGLSVLRGRGDGTFAAAVDQPNDAGAQGLATADFNGDGNADLVEVYPRPMSRVRVLLGNGDGTFRLGADYLPGRPLGGLAVADFNADGTADLAVLGVGDPVHVLLGNGDGTFRAGSDAPVLGPQTVAIAVASADVNGDHQPDLVVLTDDGFGGAGFQVLLGTGAGGFTLTADRVLSSRNQSSFSIADATGDGLPDLVMSAATASAVGVLAGDGAGGFHARVEYPVPFGPAFGAAVVVADVTGDGRPDLLVSGGSELIATCLPDPGPPPPPPGDAGVPDAPSDAGVPDAPADAPVGPDPAVLCAQIGFPVLPRPRTGLDPQSVVVADVDLDHQPDLVVTNRGDATVSVLLGRGHGAFATKLDVRLAAAAVSSSVADVDRDGVADLIAATGNASVALGHGDGTFGSATEFATGGTARWVATGDLDRDGNRDLVVSNTASAQLSVLRGRGDGTFAAPMSYPTGLPPGVPVLVDLDRDGVLDVVLAADNAFNSATDGTADAVAVWLGRGDGTLGPRVDYPTGKSPSAVVAVDLDRDGVLDLAVASSLARVTVLRGNGDGTFQPHVDYGVASPLGSIAAADLNGDGVPDIAAGTRFGNFSMFGGFVVLLGNGDGTLRIDHADAFFGGDGRQIALADLTGDGKIDLVAPAGAAGNLAVVVGNGNGTFQDQVPRLAPDALAFADFDHDAKLDSVDPQDRDAFGVQLGNGDGTFQRLIRWRMDRALNFATAADVDHDGNLDVVTYNNDEVARDVSVTVVLGNGDGSFQPPIDTFPFPDFPPAQSIAAGDVDGDGNADVAYVTNGVHVLFSDGHGRFRGSAEVGLFQPDAFPWRIQFVDVDGDGKLDLVSLSIADSIAVLHGNGDGTFQPPVLYPAGTSAQAFAVADITGDGKPDLVVADFGGSVTALRNAGDGTFTTLPSLAAGGPLVSLGVGDVTGDGVPDIVVDGPRVLRGNGDGTFQPAADFNVGPFGDPVQVVAFTSGATQNIITNNRILSLRCPP